MKRVIFITAVIVVFVSIMVVHASAAENKVYTGYADDEGYYYLDGMPEAGEYSLSFSYTLWSGHTGTISVDRLILSPVSDGLYTSFYAIVPTYGDQELYMSIMISGNYFSVGNDDVYFKSYENFKLVSLSSVDPDPEPDPPPEPDRGPEPTLGSSLDVNEVYDYMDFVTDIKVEGDKDLVTLVIPAGKAYWITEDYQGYRAGWVGKTAVFHTGAGHNVALYPFGSRNFMDVAFLPNGSTVNFKIHVTTHTKFLFDESWAKIYYYTDDGYLSSTQFKDLSSWTTGTDEVIFDVMFTVDKLDSAKIFALEAAIGSARSAAGTHVQYWCGDTVIQFKISSAYLEAQRSGQTNKLLNAIEDQLEKQGTTMEEIAKQQQQTNDKLDDIISGSQEDQDAADDFKDKTDGAVGDLNAAGDALSSVQKPEVDIGSFVPGELLGTSYLNFIAVLTTVWDQSTLTGMVTIMVGFLLISLLLHGKKG